MSYHLLLPQNLKINPTSVLASTTQLTNSVILLILLVTVVFFLTHPTEPA